MDITRFGLNLGLVCKTFKSLFTNKDNHGENIKLKRKTGDVTKNQKPSLKLKTKRELIRWQRTHNYARSYGKIVVKYLFCVNNLIWGSSTLAPLLL